MVLEFPAYYKFFNDYEVEEFVGLDRANGWDYFIVPPPKVIKGVIIDAQLGLNHGSPIVLKRGCI